jgi:hypothetical protein
MFVLLQTPVTTGAADVEVRAGTDDSLAAFAEGCRHYLPLPAPFPANRIVKDA